MAGRRLFNPRQHNSKSAFKLKIWPMEGKPYVVTFQLLSELDKAKKDALAGIASGNILKYQQVS